MLLDCILRHGYARDVQVATLGDDDDGRLAELRSYGILDTGAEDSFDNLARIAAVLCDVPIVLIALVDRDREWFKARIGVTRREVPRASGLCAQAILQDELIEVSDVAMDPQFSKNILVTGAPYVRFFAGMPLITSRGYRLGAICVLDQRPRRLNQTQYDTLHILAAQVMEHLDARRRLRELISANGASARLRLAPDPMSTSADTPTVDLVAGHQPLRSAASEPLQCGRFKILRRVGVGGMATVYAALDAELDRCIAIKLLHGDSNPESWARIQREAQALARISHPNVIQIFEIGVYGAHVFVAMELVDGLTLSAWTKARRRSLADIVGMYVQAGRGLVAAHSAGIIHRDFKPENVIVSVDGCAKIVDFGIARMLHTSANSPHGNAGPGGLLLVTQAGAIVGTPAYMSPEQYCCGAIDERSDQFNYCASLFEAVYGQRPFVGATLAELQTNIVEGVIQVPAAHEGVPAALHRALLRGLALDPAKRWDSLAHLLDYLGRFARVSEPGGEHERRVLVRLLVALVVFVAIILSYRFSTLPLTDGPGDLVLIADGALALGLTVAWFVRNTLLVDRVHRRMIGIILFLLAADCISRVGCMLAGFSVFHILLAEMLSVSAGLSALALFVQPSLWLLAGMFLLGAVAVVLADDPVLVAAMVFLGSLVLFAHEWRRASRDGIA